jgi:hypothetical protein
MFLWGDGDGEKEKENGSSLFCWCLWNFPECAICEISLWNSCAGASAISLAQHMMIHKFISACSTTRQPTYTQNYCFDAKSCKIFWCESGRVWGKMRFSCKNQMNSLLKPDTAKNTQRDCSHRQRKEMRDENCICNFEGFAYEKFVSTLARYMFQLFTQPPFRSCCWCHCCEW